MKLKGTKEYRHKDNPLEKVFHDKFIEMFSGHYSSQRTLSHIVCGTDEKNSNIPKRHLTDEELVNCVNLIQWLGSNVGQGFLADCGFFKDNKK